MTAGEATWDPTLLSVTSRLQDDGLVVDVRGEADLHTAEELRAQLAVALASTAEPVTIDVSGLTFCGVAGLTVLQSAMTTAAESGATVTIAGMSRQLAWMYQTFAGAMSPTAE